MNDFKVIFQITKYSTRGASLLQASSTVIYYFQLPYRVIVLFARFEYGRGVGRSMFYMCYNHENIMSSWVDA